MPPFILDPIIGYTVWLHKIIPLKIEFMEITICTKEDFDQIILEFNEFWDHDRTVALHHPTLLNELC
jgi:hypothetical protein